jgi:hypothetical protein
LVALVVVNVGATIGGVGIVLTFMSHHYHGLTCLRLVSACPTLVAFIALPSLIRFLLFLDMLATLGLLSLMVELTSEMPGGGSGQGSIFPWLGSTLLLIATLAAIIVWRLFCGLNRRGAEVRALSLKSALAERGYGWMNHQHYVALVLAGSKASRLPPWDHVGTLPGVSEGDIPALANLAKTLP